MAPKRMFRVLLIDDESEICFLLGNMLARQGMVCLDANSMAQGRSLLAEGPLDLVFLDIHLPDGLGYDLIPELRAKHPGVRVIAISALDQEAASASAMGADLFLPKPLSRSAVLQGLRRLGLLSAA